MYDLILYINKCGVISSNILVISFDLIVSESLSTSFKGITIDKLFLFSLYKLINNTKLSYGSLL